MMLNCPGLKACWGHRYDGCTSNMDAATKYADAGNYDEALNSARNARDELFALCNDVRGLVRALERRDYSSAKPIASFAGCIYNTLLLASEMFTQFTCLSKS